MQRFLVPTLCEILTVDVPSGFNLEGSMGGAIAAGVVSIVVIIVVEVSLRLIARRKAKMEKRNALETEEIKTG